MPIALIPLVVTMIPSLNAGSPMVTSLSDTTVMPYLVFGNKLLATVNSPLPVKPTGYWPEPPVLNSLLFRFLYSHVMVCVAPPLGPGEKVIMTSLCEIDSTRKSVAG